MPDPGHPNASERQAIAKRPVPDCWEATRLLNSGWDCSLDGRQLDTGKPSKRRMVIGGRGKVPA